MTAKTGQSMKDALELLKTGGVTTMDLYAKAGEAGRGQTIAGINRNLEDVLGALEAQRAGMLGEQEAAYRKLCLVQNLVDQTRCSR